MSVFGSHGPQCRGYDTALVCESGHEINRRGITSPEFNSAFCRRCGAKSVQACRNCGGPIRGYFHVPGVADLTPYDVPAYCHACGKQYPWTTAKICAAKELAEELDGLKRDEREALKSSIEDLVADNPRTTVAATRFKRLAAKGGKMAVEGFRSILVEVISETAKKIIFP